MWISLVIAECLSARQLIPQYGAKSQLEFVCMYVCTCMYVYMYVSITLKNARMSRLGMQFYTTTELGL